LEKNSLEIKFLGNKIPWSAVPWNDIPWKKISLLCRITKILTHGGFLEGVYEIELDTKTEYEGF
jgi:hypothetical protein